MIYLIKSYGYRGKSVLKIGFTDDIQKRIYQYFSSNPMMEVLSTREGDEIFEKLLHRYLCYFGFQYKRFGRLDEWFIDSPEVKRIFHISRETLEKKIWKHRDKILNVNSSTDFRLFEYLYQKNKENFEGERIIFKEGKLVQTKAKKIDVAFWKSWRKQNKDKILEENFNDSLFLSNDINIIQDFLDNHFYKTGFFHEKMRLYCEFMDKYSGCKEIEDIIYYKIRDDRFRKYYNFYGTKGCSSRCYKEIELYRGWKNITLESQLEEKIKNSFKIGEKYSIPDIKEILNRFNKELGISKKAKATDLENYFKLFRVRITLSDGKIIFGYRLDSL